MRNTVSVVRTNGSATIRGRGGNLSHIRLRYREQTGEEWPGTDYHLSTLVQHFNTMKEVLARMVALRIPVLPDEAKRRPLGHVSDADLLAEIAKRPKLFT